MGVKFLGIQRASDGGGGYVIPTERYQACQARRAFQMFTTQYKPFINTLQENGIPKIVTGRVVGEVLLHYTCFKEKDLCVAVATDGAHSPFAVKQLFENILMLSTTLKDPVKLQAALSRRLLMEVQQLSPNDIITDSSVAATNAAEVDRLIDEIRKASGTATTNTSTSSSPADSVGYIPQPAIQDHEASSSSPLLSDLEFREIPVVMRRHSRGKEERPEPLDLSTSSTSSQHHTQGFSPAIFGATPQINNATATIPVTDLPSLSPSELTGLSPASLEVMSPTTWDSTVSSQTTASAGSTLRPQRGMSGADTTGRTGSMDGVDSGGTPTATTSTTIPTSPRTTRGDSTDLLFLSPSGVKPPPAPTGPRSSSIDVFDAFADLGLMSPKTTPTVNVTATITEDLAIVYSGGNLKLLVVEGAVHVSMNPHLDKGFHLHLLDKAGQVGSVIANPAVLKADEANSSNALSSTLSSSNSTTTSYQCSLPLPKTPTDRPTGNSGFVPALKYRTSESLKPMPVRIQSRLQLQKGKARLVAQVTVNPALSKPLSSIAVMFQIPAIPDITYTTAFAAKPGTAQWNPTASVVEWRLQQLTPGTKQLLEAYIGINDTTADLSTITPPSQLPALFKCQSLDCLLSKVDVRVASGGEDMEIVAKVQKRFRLNFKQEAANA